MSMRPKYETSKDLANEKRIIRPYAEAFGYDYKKLPSGDYADYALFKDGELVAYVEIKRREVSYFCYDTIYLSEEKFDDLLGRDVPSIFLVGFDDGIGWVRLRPEHKDDVGLGGRTDRNDPLDIERVCHIPIEDFTAIYGTKKVLAKGENSHLWHTDQIRPKE